MATQVQFRRGTTVDISTFIGADGEVVVDTTKKTCVVNDGVQIAGYPLLREDGSNSALSVGSLSSCALKFINDPNTGIISPGADQIALVTGGASRLSVDSSGSVTIPGNLLVAGSVTGSITFDNGSAAVPALRFTNDPDTGIYLAGANELAISTGGTQRLTTTTTAVTSTLPVIHPLGAAATPSLTFTGDTNTGIYSPGADQVGISTGGTGRLFVDSAGNVGIGTSSPGANLHVAGTSASALIEATGGTTADFLIGDGTVRYYGIRGVAGGGSLQIRNHTANTTLATFTSTGNVGIGTTSPSVKLEVSGSAGSSPEIRCVDGTVNSQWYAANDGTCVFGTFSNHPQVFRTNSTERLRITSAGLVGIGTSSPSFALDVSASTDCVVRARVNSNTSAGFVSSTDNGGSNWFFGARKDPIGGSSGTDRFNLLYGSNAFLTVTTAGNVGIGTTTPNQPLEVNGIIRGGSYQFGDSSTSTAEYLGFSNANGPSLNFWGSASANAGAFIAKTAGTERLRIDSSGRVGIGTTSPGFLLQIGATGSPGIAFDSASSLIHGTFGSGGNLTLRAQLAATAGGGQIYLGGDTRGDGDVNAIIFSNANTERARIDSSGRLLVGTSSTSATTGLLVQGAGGAAPGIIRACYTTATPGNGDTFGYLVFGDSAHADAAWIAATRDGGTWSGSSKPTRLSFATCADGASSPTERMRIDNAGNVYVGTTNLSPAENNITGVVIRPAGFASDFTGEGGPAVRFNRKANDGNIVSLRQDGTEEGSISISGTTVSYNGAHLSRWSQLPGGAERTEILRGSVLSNIDEMCEWTDEENEQLNRMKVSDVEGDKNVSGVFQAWDDDDNTYTNDFYCAMTGDFIIRIAEGVTVERGDLLMSAGDGTAKPQDDDIIRSKTIAKVTSTNVTCTYDDGSYCVPCVLMAC